MKKILTLTLFFSGIIFPAIISPVRAQCKAKAIVKKCKGDLSPFMYDAFVLTEIYYKPEKQIVEVEFTAMSGEDYKLVFCTSELHKPIGISIYDKPKTNKKRKVLYFDENSKDGYLCTFKPEKTGTYYIEYAVPSDVTIGKPKSGCVVMLIGLK
jgi:hypothetical protein